jgi:heme A synthase
MDGMPVLTESLAAAPAAQRRFARYAWAVVVYNLFVVMWGAYVRATGSGAGCGSHWPLCNGQVLPRTPALATVIEFTHRLTSGLDLLLVAGLLVWAFRAFPKGHAARLGAVLSTAFLITEALLGAGLVLFDHVARNASITRAWSLSAHLINTLTLLACLTLTAWWASGGARLQLRSPALWPALIGLAALAVTGVSGAIAALGDTLFPVKSLAEGWAADFSGSAHLFVRLRMAHPFVAVAAGAWILYYSVSLAVAATDDWLRRFAWSAALITVAQLLAGVMNLLLLAPVWMQLFHLLLADLLWIALVLAAARRMGGASQ